MADSSTEKKRTEEHGVRYVKGRWSEWSLDGHGIECETKEQTSGLSTEDLKWLLEPHIATYVPEHSALAAAQGEGWVPVSKVTELAKRFWELSEGEGQAGNVSRELLWREAEELTRALLPPPPKAEASK